MKTATRLPLLFLLLFFLATSSSYSQSLTLNTSVVAACDHDGTAIATPTNGTPPYSYTWYYGANSTTGTSDTLSGLSGGWLYVIVTDSNGLSGSAQLNVPTPFNLSVKATPDTCSQGLGTATVTVTGGTSPYSYLWSNGNTTDSVSGLPAGQFDVEVTDSAGCKLSASDLDSGGVYIFNSSPITQTNTTTASSCNDGTATITPANGTPPYTYYWKTTPVQTTQTASNLPSGWATVVVTDSSGCFQEFWINIPQGPSPIALTMTTTPETCLQSNGTASITASGGTGPYTYLWSTGATTTSISGLSYGYYTVTVTDNGGCTNSKGKAVLKSSPINLTLSKTNPTCGNSDGTVTASASGGATPYTYLWSDGQTSQVATNLGPGYHGVTVTDTNGCTKYKYTYISYPTNCFGWITGKVWSDKNGSCTNDVQDFGMPNRLVKSTPGGYTTTNSSGNYTFKLMPNTYTIDHTVPNYFSQICPSSPPNYSITVASAGSVSSGNDFWDQPVGTVNDLRVSMYCWVARPGFNQKVRIRYFNDGNTTLTASLTFVHDTAVSYNFASPSAASYNAGSNTATWNLGILKPGASGYITVYLSIPTNATVGSVVTHSADVTPATNDTTASNNSYTCNRIVTASFDPNNKEVTPEGLIQTTQNPLYYVVNFQNTGTDTAFTVEIRDTLSANLDVTTFLEGAASHPYEYTIEGAGELTFTFNNILLPDSNVNEAESHGFVSFYIDQMPNLTAGTTIENSASIYFDFNSPILTNTVTNTIDGPLHYDENERAHLGLDESKILTVYPNPARETVTIAYKLDRDDYVNISLFDLTGHLIYNSGRNKYSEGLHKMVLSPEQLHLSAGFYFVKAKIGNETLVKKLSVRK